MSILNYVLLGRSECILFLLSVKQQIDGAHGGVIMSNFTLGKNAMNDACHFLSIL